MPSVPITPIQIEIRVDLPGEEAFARLLTDFNTRWPPCRAGRISWIGFLQAVAS